LSLGILVSAWLQISSLPLLLKLLKMVKFSWHHVDCSCKSISSNVPMDHVHIQWIRDYYDMSCGGHIE
jgi:hypothetical protein